MNGADDFEATKLERSFAFAGLVIAGLGLLNQFEWHRPLIGLSPKQVAIIAFVPLFCLANYVRYRMKSRSDK